MCAADAECLSFEIATERERDYYGMNCCLEHTHSGKKGAPNLWLGPDDVDGKRCKNRIRGWSTHQFSERIEGSYSRTIPEKFWGDDCNSPVAGAPCCYSYFGSYETYWAEGSNYSHHQTMTAAAVCGKKIEHYTDEAKDQPAARSGSTTGARLR